MVPPLSDAQTKAFADDGFVVVRGFAEPDRCRAMLDRAVAIARSRGGDGVGLVLPESQPGIDPDGAPEDITSKIFMLARDTVFAEFATDDRVVDLVAQLLGRQDCDCFLSQFIFKNPGAWGQPWHQDSY